LFVVCYMWSIVVQVFRNWLILHFIWHYAGADAWNCSYLCNSWLKKVYLKKMKPLEVAYTFTDFTSPLYVVLCVIMSLLVCHHITSTIFQTCSDFVAKPLLLDDNFVYPKKIV
jgi:hypothetical protein